MATILEILGGLSGQQKPVQNTLNLAPTPAQKAFNPDEQGFREFILSLGGDIAKDQSPLPAGQIPPNPLPESAFADKPIQLPPQGEQSFIAKLLGFPGAGDPNIAEVAQQGVEAIQPTLRNIFEPGPEPVAPPQVPPTLAKPVDTQKTVESFIGASLDDITTGKFEVKPENIIVPATEEVAGATPEEINTLLQGTGDDTIKAKVEQGFLDRPGMRDLLLGVGISLLQGKGIGDAMATGVAMMKQAASGEAAGKRQGALDDAEIGLKKAQARKANADATKTASAAGLTGAPLKGFRQTFKTLVGEQGAGDDKPIQRAQAQAAKQELAAAPDSKPLQKIQDDSVTSILRHIDGLDIEDAREELEKLRNEFGTDYVNGLATQISGG